MISSKKISAVFRDPWWWAWLILATLPLELATHALGWGFMDPGYWFLTLAWWPLGLWGQLKALEKMLFLDVPPSASTLRTVFSADLSLELGFTVRVLAASIPALWIFSLGVFLNWPSRLFLGLLGVAALTYAWLWTLQRSLAPLLALQGVQGGPQALEASAQRLKDRFGAYFAVALPWILASWALQGLGLALPEWAALALQPLSLGLQLVPLALSLAL